MVFLELAGFVGVYTGLALSYVKFLDWLDGPKRRQCNQCGRSEWIHESQLFDDKPTENGDVVESELERLGRNQILRDVCTCSYQNYLLAKQNMSNIVRSQEGQEKDSISNVNTFISGNEVKAAPQCDGNPKTDLRAKSNRLLAKQVQKEKTNQAQLLAYVVNEDIVLYDRPVDYC